MADIGLQDWNNDGKVNKKDQEFMKAVAKQKGASEIEPFNITPTWVHME